MGKYKKVNSCRGLSHKKPRNGSYEYTRVTANSVDWLVKERKVRDVKSFTKTSRISRIVRMIKWLA